MTASEGAAQAVQLPEVPLAETVSKSAQRAKSLTSAPVKLADVTQGDRIVRVRNASDVARARVLAALSGPSLLHAQPKSLAQSREHHHRAAGHFEVPVLRWARVAWGYWHLSVKALLHLLEWVLESPPRLVVAAVLGVVIWLWI